MYKCPFCDESKRKIADIRIHIGKQHIDLDYKARWLRQDIDEFY